MSSPHSEDTQAEVLERTREALAEGAPERAAETLRDRPASEIADVLEACPPEERAQLWARVDAQAKGDVLVEAHDEVRRQLIGESTADELVAAVQRLDLDELVDLHDQLPAGVVEAVLSAMDAQRRERFQVVRTYPPDTAGGLMDVDAIAVRADFTLRMVLSALSRYRAENERLPAHTDAVMVTDHDGRYRGRIALTDLVSRELDTRVEAVMDGASAPIAADAPAARVARRFEDEDLVSAAVVDAEGRLIGRITVDDVVDVIREQAENSVMAGAGLDAAEDTFAPALASAGRRAIWLGVNLVSAFAAAWVIGRFEHAIDQLVALAVLMPVVASMGGVAGTQSLALVIRGIALEQVRPGNRLRLLGKEVSVGVVNGVLWALAVALVATLWFERPALSLVFGAAMVLNLIWGVAAGTLIPLLLERMRIDPALAGGVVLVALTDAFGFFVFLGLATLVLL
ncbi:MAG: magnesium transporter [Burkholderiales bacterium]|nr:magnesium transporter [Burkholderiales bacterium]